MASGGITYPVPRQATEIPNGVALINLIRNVNPSKTNALIANRSGPFIWETSNIG